MYDSVSYSSEPLPLKLSDQWFSSCRERFQSAISSCGLSFSLAGQILSQSVTVPLVQPALIHRAAGVMIHRGRHWHGPLEGATSDLYMRRGFSLFQPIKT